MRGLVAYQPVAYKKISVVTARYAIMCFSSCSASIESTHDTKWLT